MSIPASLYVSKTLTNPHFLLQLRKFESRFYRPDNRFLKSVFVFLKEESPNTRAFGRVVAVANGNRLSRK